MLIGLNIFIYDFFDINYLIVDTTALKKISKPELQAWYQGQQGGGTQECIETEIDYSKPTTPKTPRHMPGNIINDSRLGLRLYKNKTNPSPTVIFQQIIVKNKDILQIV